MLDHIEGCAGSPSLSRVTTRFNGGTRIQFKGHSYFLL
ncbi:hypothetical protein SLEP1_g15881 [Rubroshorea leprosula]|uniref:Uncharacterized protein n=1 Tax=Rubroshorea leprosula TaxID=152421 RepID=A0AAV5INZ7_9ROSI|nr:hypothetical protein SLEP1_g15881 [Rubroshorea leprosula]